MFDKTKCVFKCIWHIDGHRFVKIAKIVVCFINTCIHTDANTECLIDAVEMNEGFALFRNGQYFCLKPLINVEYIVHLHLVWNTVIRITLQLFFKHIIQTNELENALPSWATGFYFQTDRELMPFSFYIVCEITCVCSALNHWMVKAGHEVINLVSF